MFVQGSQPGGSKGSADSNEHVDISDEPGHILFAVHVVHQKRGNDIDAGNTEDIEGAVHDDRALGNAEKGQSHSRSGKAQGTAYCSDGQTPPIADPSYYGSCYHHDQGKDRGDGRGLGRGESGNYHGGNAVL